jgi:hypothetical protein
LAGERPSDGRRRGNRGASAAARFPTKCEGEDKPLVIVEALVEVWAGGTRGSVGLESKRMSRLTTAVLMATAADGVF